MRTIGFIGGYDKTDFVIYIAKLLTLANQKVLVVDQTKNQKARYIVPTMTPTVSYMTTYEDFDVAIGFSSLKEIAQYAGKTDETTLDYDIILVDTDQAETLETMKLQDDYKNYFVTSFDVYSIKKGLEVIGNSKETISLTRILFEKEIDEDYEEYLNYLSMGYPVKWDKNIIYMPFEEGDQTAIIENQRVEQIRFRNLTNEYREGVVIVAQECIAGLADTNEIKRALKLMERGV